MKPKNNTSSMAKKTAIATLSAFLLCTQAVPAQAVPAAASAIGAESAKPNTSGLLTIAKKGITAKPVTAKKAKADVTVAVDRKKLKNKGFYVVTKKGFLLSYDKNTGYVRCQPVLCGAGGHTEKRNRIYPVRCDLQPS